jgi:hypothetical protein
VVVPCQYLSASENLAWRAFSFVGFGDFQNDFRVSLSREYSGGEMLLLAVFFNAKLSVNQVSRQRKSKVKVI